MMSVNLSSKQLVEPDLVEQIDQILQETGLAPEHLKLEITESVIMEHPPSAAEVLKRLKERGIRLSLDDFGTGYSSLSYLHRFPIDTLKVDRSFINRLDVEDGDPVIVQTIVALRITWGCRSSPRGSRPGPGRAAQGAWGASTGRDTTSPAPSMVIRPVPCCTYRTGRVPCLTTVARKSG